MPRQRIEELKRMRDPDDFAAEFLVIFYKYISDTCEKDAEAKLKKILDIMARFAKDEKSYGRFRREVEKQFREDKRLFCTR